MTNRRVTRLVWTLAAAALWMTLHGAHAGSWLGDAGNFLCHTPAIFANNPDGKAFAVTVHRHVWPADWANGATNSCYTVQVLDPAGTRVATGKIPWMHENVRIDMPAGAKGVYRIEYQGAGYALTWIECSLDQMVVGMGDWDMREGPYKTFILHVMEPRRWYFYVPADVEHFDVKHTILPFQSHREDYGFFVMGPRGQRMQAFFGGKPLDVETRKPNEPIPVVRTVETDPGTAGRFWNLWATGGDSHSFSDLQVQVQGVPPFYASAPEQWFDPRTGQAAPKLVYDDSPVRVRDQKNEQGAPVSRDHYLWTPATFLGDEDYNGWRGPQTLWLSNPDNRPIDLGVVTYIADDSARFPVHYRVLGPDGKRILDRTDSYGHHRSSRVSIPASGGGVYRVDIEAGKWFPWTEPTTPVVMAGKPAGQGTSRFELELGIAKHWFFLVPAGTRQFRVGVSVVDTNHVLQCEVHAPDRMMDLLYVRGGAPRDVRIDVPAGLDGCIWFLRTDVGSANRFVSGANDPRHNRVEADIDLTGVPGYLAPTWEQWFNPNP